MPAAIVETPGKGEAINAPIGADLRNAASVRVPFQSVGNRLKFLEDFYDLMKVFLLGGTLAPAAGVVINTAAGGIEIVGDDDFGLEIGVGAKLFPHGRMGDHMFNGSGGYGRANSRLRVESIGSNTTIDPTLHDLVHLTPTGANRVATITPSITPVRGDRCVIVNESDAFTVQVNKPDASSLFTLGLADTNTRYWIEIVYDGSAWKLSHGGGLL